MKYLSAPWGRSTICSLALVIVLAALVAAQDYRAKIQGVVEDSVNAAIPNAKVVLKNECRDGSIIPERLIKEGYKLRSFKEEEINLEDVFMSVTRGDVQ